ncbi:hypothetical protein AHAS_Ahas18G0149600 [Arachis hypogaea]
MDKGLKVEEDLRKSSMSRLYLVGQGFIVVVTLIDNMKVLKAFSTKDDSPPLYDCASKKKVSLEPLRRKNVLLVILGLEFSPDELLILEQIYNESSVVQSRLERKYEIVWLPIVELHESE